MKAKLSIPDYIHDIGSRMDHMAIGFPARFKMEDNGQYSVFFLGKGMEGCITYGSDMEEAKHNAQEAQDGYLRSLCSHREKIQPRKHVTARISSPSCLPIALSRNGLRAD